MNGFALDGHILEQPGVVAALLESEAWGLDRGRPVVFSGIGTSLHACRVAAAWVRQVTHGAVRPAAINAHDLAITEVLRPEDQVVVVSHRGTKRYPNEVLRAARLAGATTVAVVGQGDAEPEADCTLRTCSQERASTHTVSYTAALAVLGKLVCSTFGDEARELAGALERAPAAMESSLQMPIGERVVDALVGAAAPAVIAGTWLDAVTADEAALKIKEGTYRWAEGMHTEFGLHGTPAVFSSSTVAFLIVPAHDDGGRTEDLRGLLERLHATALTCSADEDSDLPFAAVHDLARPLVSILPFQRLVSSAARRLGSNPDLTHLEAEPWGSAIRSVTL
jgi:glutamine---fructose-6-phosphate transaminase (isomerizing)